MYTAIFLSLIVAAWLLLGFLPWLAWSVATRGQAGLGMLPLCLFGALVAGLAVPVLGKDDGMGMVISGVAAVAAPTLLLVARRLSPEPANERAPGAEHGKRASE